MNRYEDVPWFFAGDVDDVRAFNERFTPSRLTDFDIRRSTAVMVNSEMTLDLLAFEQWGDARLWKTIGEINWPIVEDPLECPDGVKLIVPSQDQVR